MIDLRPVGGQDPGRIIVKRDPWQEQTEAGIALPPVAVGQWRDDRRPRTVCGTVLAVYEGCSDMRPGMRIAFWERAGTDLVFGGETVTIMWAGEALAEVE